MVSKYEILSNQKDPKILTGSPKPFLVKSSMLDLEIFIPDHKTFPKMQKKTSRENSILIAINLLFFALYGVQIYFFFSKLVFFILYFFLTSL